MSDPKDPGAPATPGPGAAKMARRPAKPEKADPKPAKPSYLADGVIDPHGQAMSTRGFVTFTRPFSLTGFRGVQPAGRYSVEIDDSLMEGMTYAPYREMATMMRVGAEPSDGDTGQVAIIDPKELQKALVADAVPPFPPGFGEVIKRSVTRRPEEPGDATRHSLTAEIRRLYLSVEHDAGATDVRLGVMEFNCVGGVPLQQHAHVFLSMGDGGTVRCPVCKTVFHFDSSIPPLKAGMKRRVRMG